MARTSPVDPDIEVRGRARRPPHPAERAVLAAVAVGGILGSEARYALGLALPHGPGSWPLATLVINVSGSLLIGGLMVVLTELTAPHRLLRPFLGVGLLGGWTTFSTAMVEPLQLLRAGRPALAAGYLVGTALAALLATAAGAALARTAARGWGRRRRRRPREQPR